MKGKGVNYEVGIAYDRATVCPEINPKLMKREIAIIKNDLHCNAIRILGTNLKNVIEAGEIALREGLEVWLSPYYIDYTFKEIKPLLLEGAREAEKLRLKYPDRRIVYTAGCEFIYYLKGLYGGETFTERFAMPDFAQRANSQETMDKINAALKELAAEIREVYNGELTYASGIAERIDWSVFDSLSFDHYRSTWCKDIYAELLKPYFAYGKPVVLTEFGVCTFTGAAEMGSLGFTILQNGMVVEGYERNEKEQADEIINLLNLLEAAGIDSAFVFTFVCRELPHHETDPRKDVDMACFSIVKTYEDKNGTTYPDVPWEPKEAFYRIAEYYSK